jgi:hypothetical protein
MSMLITIVSLLSIGFLIGFNTRNLVSFYENKKKIKSLNKKFLNILNELESGRSKFRTRFSNTVYININLEEYGKVDVVYMIDKNDIALFKGSDCILTTHSVNREIIDKIINKIKRFHDNDINDIVNIFGLIMNRKEFENLTKVKIEDFGKIRYDNELSDINKIVKSNESKFNIDDILDKISSIGIESLSSDEKRFLEDYSRNR